MFIIDDAVFVVDNKVVWEGALDSSKNNIIDQLEEVSTEYKADVYVLRRSEHDFFQMNIDYGKTIIRYNYRLIL